MQGSACERCKHTVWGSVLRKYVHFVFILNVSKALNDISLFETLFYSVFDVA